MAEQQKYTLITGGSSGIGKALARECAARQMDLLLVALDGPELAETAAEIKEKFSVRVETLGIDLTELEGPARVLAWCEENNYRVNILINNAGIAGSAVFEDSALEYSDVRILLNVRALVLLTRLFLPELKSHTRAYILNTGSMSAYYSIAYKSVYAATKAFVLSFSRALKEELRGSGVSLTVVNPNGVRTNADTHKRIATHGKYANLVILPAERIAKIAIDGMLKGKTSILPGYWNRVLLLLTKLIPSHLREKSAADMFQERTIRKQLRISPRRC